MMNKGLFLGFCLIFSSNFILGNACGAYKNDDDENSRKKRQIQNNKEIVTRTKQLRDYFTACLTAQAPQIKGWRTNVEYSVLDTIWFENNALLSCGFGSFIRAECWKNNLRTYIGMAADITPYIERCIDDYTMDFSQNPPNLTRYPLIKSDENRSTRTLKQSTSVGKTDNYASCLKTAVNVSQDPDYDLNFVTLSEFINQYTVTNSCYAATQFSAAPDNQTWPRRFVEFTRSNSPLRDPLQECGENFFPGVFPVEDPVVVTMGFWGTWSNWGECSCENGEQSRTRKCVFVDNGTLVNDPTLCGCYQGFDACTTEKRSCIAPSCDEILPYWSEWVQISSCSATCGSGQEIRVRICRSGETNEMIDYRQCPAGLHTKMRICHSLSCPLVPRNVRLG